MKVGDLIRIQYRLDWKKIGIVLSVPMRHRAKVQWNDGKTTTINILDFEHHDDEDLDLEVISASR